MSTKCKKKSYYKTLEVENEKTGKHTIVLYGEFTENDLVEGYVLQRVEMTRKGREIRNYDDDYFYFMDRNTTHAPVKTFNMGWAICNSEDTFSEEEGIKQAKKRFGKSPLKTQNGNFLTDDMINAIMDHELVYIAEHIEKFIAKFKNKTNKRKYKKPITITIG